MAKHPRSARQQPAAGQSAPAITNGTAAASVQSEAEDGVLGTRLATVAAVGIAAALIEVDWIPGVLLGAAAVMAPNLLPKVGRGLRPFVKGAVRAGYSVVERTRETVAEASEQFQDIVAEVRAEGGSPEGVAEGAAHVAEAAAENA